MFTLLIALACGRAQPDTPAPPEPAATPATPELHADKVLPSAGCDPTLADKADATVPTLVTMGMRCERADDPAAGASLFTAALKQTPDHDGAHYHLARCLALLRANGEVCRYDATRSNILDHLAHAADASPQLRAHIAQDPAFEPIRDTVRFQVLTGADLSQDDVISAVVQTASFYGPAQGAMGNTTRLDLREGSRAVMERRTIAADGAVNWSPAAVGSWTVRGGKVDLELGEESWQMTLDPQTGTLSDARQVRWVNLPAECSA